MLNQTIAEAIKGQPKPAVVRGWAVKQGKPVSDRGRVPKNLVKEYLAAVAAADTSMAFSDAKAAPVAEAPVKTAPVKVKAAPIAEAPAKAAPVTKAKAAPAKAAPVAKATESVTVTPALAELLVRFTEDDLAVSLKRMTDAEFETVRAFEHLLFRATNAESRKRNAARRKANGLDH